MTDNDTQSPLAVQASGLCKRFGGVQALDDVTLDFPSARITAVLGENGAGKSTLMTIMAGLQRPDSGTLIVHGRTVGAYSPSDMLEDYGIALVPQEIAICRDRTVAENVLLGREPGAFPARRAMVEQTRALLREIDTDIDPAREAGLLSVAEQQLVLIARALARECRVLILDEPTTSLTPHESSRLFTLLRRLRDAGTTIIYVSHRLPEIIELSDLVHVLRDGRHVASFSAGALSADRLITAMVGRELAAAPAGAEGRQLGPPLLEVRDLSSTKFSGVSLTVAAGEIVGVAGLPDSGSSEVLAALFGAVPADGDVRLGGQRLRVRSPRDAMRAAIGYVPAERRSQALFPDLTVAANATVLDVDTSARLGLVSHRRLRRLGATRLAEYDVRGRAAGTVTSLSGGNQQKVILSRWLARRPRLLLLDDPTRGVDVGAKAEIHDRLVEAARGGAAVLVASSDLPELLRVCDRIVVLARGRVTGSVDARTTTETEVMALATVGAAASASTAG